MAAIIINETIITKINHHSIVELLWRESKKKVVWCAGNRGVWGRWFVGGVKIGFVVSRGSEQLVIG